MTILEIEFDDGSTETLDVLAGSITNEYEKQKHAYAEVFRDEWEQILSDLDKINDEFYIEQDGTRKFGGRLVNYSNKKSIVELELGSFEEDAMDTQPTDGTLPAVGVSDSFVVENAISGNNGYPGIPLLTAGTVETISNDVSFVFSNSSSAGIIRQAQKTTGAFVEYDGVAKEINYEEYPEGQTPSITVGPQQDNVQDDFEVVENEREEFTNLRVLGAADGKSQIKAEGAIPSYDGSGREKWRKFTDKDITREDRAQEVLDKMLTEYDENPVRLKIETRVFGEDISLGTPVEVVSERDGINEPVMYATKVKEIFDGAKNIKDVVLSNRLLTQEQKEAKEREDIEKFNETFQGDVVTVNSGGYRAPVDDGLPYTFSIRKPDDVVNELDAEIEIESLPYRSYSSGAASGGGSHSHDVEFNVPDHTHGIDATADGGASTAEIAGPFTEPTEFSEDESFFFDLPDIDDSSLAIIYVHIYNSVDTRSIRLTVWDNSGQPSNVLNPGGEVYREGQSHFFQGVIANPSAQAEIEVRVREDDGGGSLQFAVSYGAWMIEQHSHDIDDTTVDGGGTFVSETTEDETGPHTHPPDPGVTEFGGETASNVGVRVNGDMVESDVGSGQFNEVVDIGGTLNEGFNTVEVTSDTLGHIRATGFLDVYRQITD